MNEQIWLALLFVHMYVSFLEGFFFLSIAILFSYISIATARLSFGSFRSRSLYLIPEARTVIARCLFISLAFMLIPVIPSMPTYTIEKNTKPFRIF